MEHHPDFSVPIGQRLEVETSVGPDDGLGPIAGQAIALGWWVDAGSTSAPAHEPMGTLYLIVDERRPRPFRVK
jgi:hypothetical protein